MFAFAFWYTYLQRCLEAIIQTYILKRTLRTGLVILLAVVLIVGLNAFFQQGCYEPPPPTPTLLVPSPLSPVRAQADRLSWNGAKWYLHGANVPWYRWGCDFGCNAINGKTGGVSTDLAALATAFAQMKQAGMHVARWWVFPGVPAQILRDSSGMPTGLDPAIYRDFDAAVQLAEQYDLYYDFVLFSAPTDIPISWQTDPVQRAKLIDALSPLFARYADNPRVFSWEPYNEPENDIWKYRIAQQPVIDTGTAIAQSVHAHAPTTYVTMGSFQAEGMKLWINAGLDYYSPHWYDYMRGDNAMLCRTYEDYAAWGIDKPIVIGEFYTATNGEPPFTSAYRYDYWYTKYYAGAWAWSLFPAQTADQMAIDVSAAGTFAAQYRDIGPVTHNP